MAEQELRFHVIPQTPSWAVPTTSCTFEEGNLCGGPLDIHTRTKAKAQFLKLDEVEPVDSWDWYEDDYFCPSGVNSAVVEGKKEFNLPHSAGHCHVNGSYFLFGGYLYGDYPKSRDRDPDGSSYLVISSPSSPRPAAGLWTVCGRLPQAGISLVAVPYRGTIYVFGYPGDMVLTYDPRAQEFSLPVPMPEHYGMDICKSYFIWNEKIMLLYRASLSYHFKLLSYDVGDDRWEEFDPDFPPDQTMWNPPLLLPETNTLLIVDQPDSWRIYDLVNKGLTGETVRVEGMRRDLQDPRLRVFASFCRDSPSRGCFLVFAFIDVPYDGYLEWSPHEIAYAKIRLTPTDNGYVAAVESQGNLWVGPNFGAYIFAEPFHPL